MSAAPTPDLAGFRELARQRRVIPVTRRLLADGETPVGVYRKLAGGRPGHLPAGVGRARRRLVALLVRRRALARHADRARRAGALARRAAGRRADRRRPAGRAAATIEALHTERLPGLPPLTGGLVGVIGYDAVRRLERLPDLTTDDLHVPELAMMLATDLAVLDHADGSVLLIANAINYDATDERVDGAFDDAVERLDRMTRELAAAGARHGRHLRAQRAASTSAAASSDDYRAAVERAKEEIRAGEVFQVVVCQRFTMTDRRRPARRLPDAARRPTRARTCTCCASTASTSSAPAPRRWSRWRAAGR